MTDSPRLALNNCRLSVSGDVTPDNVGDIRSEGERLIAAHGGDVVVDLSGLGAAHSVVLSLLLCWMRLAGSRSQGISFDGVSARLESLAVLSGLDRHLPGLSRS